MYYKKIYEELKKEIVCRNNKKRNKRKLNKKLIRKMNELEKIYGDYGDMNKYCPMCGNLMITKFGQYGKFRGCSNFPKCKYHEHYKEHGIVK